MPSPTDRAAKRVVIAITALLCGCSDGDGPAAAPEPPTVDVTITAPTKNKQVFGVVTVTGTLKGANSMTSKLTVKGKEACKLAEEHPLAKADTFELDKLLAEARRYGIKYTDPNAKKDICDADTNNPFPDAEKNKIVAALKAIPADLLANCKGAGAGFAIKLDTQQVDAKNKPLFKDGKLSLTIIGSGAKQASGAGAINVVVDNAIPKLEILEPKPCSVHIGKVRVRGRVTESNLADVGLFVIDAFPGQPQRRLFKCNSKAKKGEAGSCDACKAAHKDDGAVCMGKAGFFEFMLERGKQPTKTVTLTLIAKDVSKDQVTSSTKVKMLRPPLFDVAYSRDDPKVAAISDYQVTDFDADGCQDLVLCGTTGVFVRRAKPVKPADPKQPADPSTIKCTTEFAPAEPLSAIQCASVAVVDFDPPSKAVSDKGGKGIKDIVAVGTDANGSVAQVFLSRPKVRPIRVQSIPIKGTTTASAVGQIDGAGPSDLVLGAEEDAFALSVLIAETDALCPTKELPTRLCRDATDAKTIKGGQVLKKPIIRKMLGKIRSIVVGDFIAGSIDTEGKADIAVGRSEPIISVCRNMGGGIFEACVDTGTTGGLVNMANTAILVPYNWTATAGGTDTDLDLIVGSTTGPAVRWLQGNGDGTFSLLDAHRQYHTGSVQSLTVAPIGDGGADMLVMAQNGRTVVIYDITGAAGFTLGRCFHSVILGSQIKKVIAADMDNDGTIDLTALNGTKPVGVTVARGRGDQRFHGAEVFRVCVNPPGQFARAVPVGKFVVDDVDADARPDLLIGSDGVPETTPLSVDGKPPAPQCESEGALRPAHMFHLYLNGGDQLSLKAQAAQYAPYNPLERSASGAIGDGCGTAFGKLVGLEVLDLDGSDPRDLVFATDIVYSHGKTPEDGAEPRDFDNTNQSVKLEKYEENIELGCSCLEHYEVHNLFGEDTDVDTKTFCRNLIEIEGPGGKTTKKLARGYGTNGAPVVRASLNYVLNGKASEPFQMGSSSSPLKPKRLRPYFAQAGGRGIVGITKVDYNNDSRDDVATLMGNVGAPSEACYLAPRVRVFETAQNPQTGQIIFEPLFYAVNTNWEVKRLEEAFKQANPTKIINVIKKDLSFFQAVDPKDNKALFPDYVTYRVVSPEPSNLLAAKFCADTVASLFVLGKKEHGFGVLRALETANAGEWMHKVTQTFSIGEGPQGFAVGNFASAPDSPPKCTDVAFGTKKGIDVKAGMGDWYSDNKPIFKGESSRASIDILDVNQDGFDDILALDVATDSVQVLLGDGNGKFVEEKRRIVGLAGSKDPRVADFDLDGCKDLVIQGKLGVAVYRNLACDPIQ